MLSNLSLPLPKQVKYRWYDISLLMRNFHSPILKPAKNIIKNYGNYFFAIEFTYAETCSISSVLRCAFFTIDVITGMDSSYVCFSI